MNLIVVLDDRNGMLFNHRRQSRDRVLTDRILEISGGKLTVDSYTAELFDKTSADLQICANPLLTAKQGDWCFLETLSPAPVVQKIEKLVVYRWNRIYPSDLKFDLDLSVMKQISTTDFAGFSHEKITEEVYLP
ncbi:MAG: ribonuclease Z [Ruminococcaceae bacterium]|nr:ribonuclease Z [Oscillospiraceae bacterium]